MKNRLQRLSTLLLSAAVVASPIYTSALPGIAAMVQAEEQTAIETLLDVNFDNGNLDGFAGFSEGGDCDFASENGVLTIHIRNCGEVAHGNQIYRDGFDMREGCKYRLSFDISCDIERKLEYRIQLNGGNYRAYTGEFITIGPESQHVEKNFTMKEVTDPAPRFCFNLGKQVNMTEDPGEHTVVIDNIKLELTDNSEEVIQVEEEVPMSLGLNQVGYLPEDTKILVAPGEFAGTDYEIKDVESGETVFTGTFDKAMKDAGTKTDVCQGNFTELSQDGNYLAVLSDGTESGAFSINGSVYDELFKETFRMMYLQRCGTELPEELAGDYAHPSCHDTEAVIYGTNEKKEVNGGWHDAGDYGRYTVTTAKTAADLLFTYEANKEDPLIASDDLGIAESGNGIPDILDEVRFALEWLFKMQAETTGGVYHKVSCYNFPGVVAPQDEDGELVLAPIAATSTGDFAGIMAKAAVDYAEIDAEFSAKCLDAALHAWEYLESEPVHKGFSNPPEISTGEYGDGSAADEIYWAAVELYLAGQQLGKETIPADKIPNKVPNPSLGWVEMGAYGLYDLAKTELSGAEIDKLKDKAAGQICNRANMLVKASVRDGYFVMHGTNYYWGSNMEAANSGMLLLMANSLKENGTYTLTAKRQLDYLLGVNGLGICFVSGFGSRPMADPHHRPSQLIGKAMPGMLAGGPNAGREDPYAQQVLGGVKAPALCYVDNQQSYSTNEVAIYWNSPLVYLIAGI